MRKFWIVTLVLVAVLALATAASASQGGLSSLTGSKAPDSDGGAVFSVKQAAPADDGAVCEGDGTASAGASANAGEESNAGETPTYVFSSCEGPGEDAAGDCDADRAGLEVEPPGPEAEISPEDPIETKAETKKAKGDAKGVVAE